MINNLCLLPENWNDAATLVRQRSAAWEEKKFIGGPHPLLSDALKCGVYRDPLYKTYYKADVDHKYLEFYRYSLVDNISYQFKKHHLDKQMKQKVLVQNDCFNHARLLGFHVPNHSIVGASQVTTCSKRRWKIDKAISIATLIATEEIPGPTLSQMMRDNTIDERKKGIVLQLAFKQAVILRSLYGDQDGHKENAIVIDLKTDNPLIVQFDFDLADGGTSSYLNISHIQNSLNLEDHDIPWENIIQGFQKTSDDIARVSAISDHKKKVYQKRIADAVKFCHSKVGCQLL